MSAPAEEDPLLGNNHKPSQSENPEKPSSPTKEYTQFLCCSYETSQLQNQDPVLMWSVGILFCIGALCMALVPVLVCLVDDGCKVYKDQISISSIIDSIPLATVYAVLGGITLTLILYTQIKVVKRGSKIFLSFLGYFSLLVALMFPIDEDDTIDEYHEYFATLGFFCEIVFIFLVWLDVFFAPPHIEIPVACRWVTHLSVFIIVAALLMFCIGYSIGDGASSTTAANFYLTYEIICEYTIGVVLIVLVKTIEYAGIYPLTTPYECCLPTWLTEVNPNPAKESNV